jgi:hypothetical protein
VYLVTLNELKTVLKVNTQAGHSGAVKSKDQGEDIQEVKNYRTHNTSRPAKKPTKPFPTSATVELPPKAVLTCESFAPLRTPDMDTEIICAENALQEKEAPRKSCSPPPTVMTCTTNLIRTQSDLKVHVKGKSKVRNTLNETCIIVKEMDNSAIKSYPEKSNLHYFTFFLNSVRRTKAVICHLPPDTSAEDISNGFEGSSSP